MDKRKHRKWSRRIRWDKLIGLITIFTVIICAIILMVTLKKDGNRNDKNWQTGEARLSEEKNITQSRSLALPEETASVRTVCIDAGHGGKDNGADHGGQFEKVHNLAMAKSVKKYLEQAGINVVMTRTTDVFMTLEERVKIANSKKAGIMVSIHRNYYIADTSVNGIEAWIHHSKPSDANALASGILGEINKTGKVRNRGVKSGSMSNPSEDYYINNHFKGTSCVLEIGFITNVKDNEFVSADREECAKAIAQAILQYIDQVKG